MVGKITSSQFKALTGKPKNLKFVAKPLTTGKGWKISEVQANKLFGMLSVKAVDDSGR